MGREGTHRSAEVSASKTKNKQNKMLILAPGTLKEGISLSKITFQYPFRLHCKNIFEKHKIFIYGKECLKFKR